MVAGLGAVKPWVQGAADHLNGLFTLTGVGGWRASAIDMAGHPSGRALDLMVGTNKAEGNRLAAYLIANAAPLQVDYLIWQQAIWTRTKPQWTPMSFRTGAGDQNHLRHVHVNFLPVIDDGRTFTIAGEEREWITLGKLDTSKYETPGKKDPLELLTDAGKAAMNLSPAGLLLSSVTDTNSLMANIGNKNLWIRVGQVLGGAVLIIGGVAILTKDMAIPAASAVIGAMPQGRAAKVALGAAAGAGKK